MLQLIQWVCTLALSPREREQVSTAWEDYLVVNISQHYEWFSLSLRERVGVRGNAASD
jgi:hypothetical protein